MHPITMPNEALSNRLRLLRVRFSVQRKRRFRVPSLAVLIINHDYMSTLPGVMTSHILDDLDPVLDQAYLTQKAGIPLAIVEIRNGEARNELLNYMDATLDVSSWWSLTDVGGLENIVPQVQKSIEYYSKKHCASKYLFHNGANKSKK